MFAPEAALVQNASKSAASTVLHTCAADAAAGLVDAAGAAAAA
jgi:hypothetical protein